MSIAVRYVLTLEHVTTPAFALRKVPEHGLEARAVSPVFRSASINLEANNKAERAGVVSGYLCFSSFEKRLAAVGGPPNGIFNSHCFI